MIKELLDWIETKTSYIIGTDLYLGTLPTDDDDGIAAFQVGGDENESGMQAVQINFIALNIDYTSCETYINDIYQLLAYSKGIQLATEYIHNSIPMGIPRYLGINEHKRSRWSASFVLYLTR